jgi:hypothetical protein
MKGKTSLKLFFGISAVLFGLLTIMSFASAQSSGVTVIAAGNLAIDASPDSFVFDPVEIDSASATYREYYVNPGTSTSSLEVHDGRFSGGFQVTIQSSAYTSTGGTIANTNLCIVTNEGSTVIDEILLGSPDAVVASLDGDPYDDADYDANCFEVSPLVLFAGAATSLEGRVGVYTAYPSFRLNIPTSTPDGIYSNTITYDISDDTT